MNASTHDKIDLAGRKILIIDDDATCRRVASIFLKKANYVTYEASSGEQGLKMLSEVKPDIILLDIVMVDMDGYETCREIKALPDGRDVPIIFLTGLSDSANVVKALREGGSDYITKPLRPAEALARIKVHLQVRVLLQIQSSYIEALRHASDSKSKLMGIVSHDLKNPIVSIRGLAEFLDEGDSGSLNGTQAEMIQSILSASDSMLALVDDLLDTALIDLDKVRLQISPNDLRTVVQHATTLHRINAATKGMVITLTEGDVPEEVAFDKRQIRRVLDNLLSNAIKYAPPDTSIKIHLDREGENAIFQIDDEGPGIPEDERSELFTTFGTTSVKTTGGESSTGLGLSICKKIVEAHAGIITLENLAGKGCRFRFSLPIEN